MIADTVLTVAEEQAEEVNKLRTLIDASPDVICSFNGDGTFLSVSKACMHVWGYTQKELLGTNYLDYVVEEDRDLSKTISEQIRTGTDFTNFENRYLRKDGSIVPIVWSATWDAKRKIMFCVAKDATEKKKAEQQAREYEERLYRAYQLSQLGWWEWDVINNKYHASDELYLIYGFTREEVPDITTEKFLSHIHPRDIEKVKQDLALVEIRNIYEYSHWFIRPSGELIHLTHHVQIHRDDSGKMILINGTTKETTQRKKARIELKKSKQKLQNILDSIQDCFFVVDKHWKVTYWNTKAEQMLGKKAEVIIGKSIWDEFKGAKSLKSFVEYKRAMKEQVPVQFEDYSPSTNRWFEANAYPSKHGLSVYFKDITERKQKEEELRISNERYRFVTMATTDLVWDWDLIKDEIYANDSFEKFFGNSPEPKLAFSTWTNQIHEADRKKVLASVQDSINNSSVLRWKKQYRIIKADGSVAYVSARAVFVRNEKGEAIRMVGSVSDITEARQKEEAEKELQLRYKMLFHESPIPKWIFDLQTLRFTEVNDAAVKQYGYSKEEFLNMMILDIRPQSEHEKILRTFTPDNSQPEYIFHGIMKHRKKNGELIDVEATSHLIKIKDKEQVVVVASDITEKLEAQKKLSRAIINTQEKERSVIGKELHDNVNQLLTTAKLYVQNASYYPDQKQVFLDKGVDIIQKSITEIRGLSKALITPTLSDLDFRDTLDELIDYYKELNLFKVQMDYSLKEENLEHELKLSIYRILQELFNNTIKYAKAKRVIVYLYETEQYLRVVYADDGIGFHKKGIKKGLGFNNIKNRVEIFKGKMRIQSEPGKGFTALAVFPFSDKEKVDNKVLN